MQTPRSSGVLLHPSSLSGPYGIGDLGPDAFAFVDWLAAAGFHCWQVLPLGPTGFGNSPYQCHSVFAGNPNLLSPALMLRDGLLDPTELELARDRIPRSNRHDACRVDYGTVIPWKRALLRSAFQSFDQRATTSLQLEFKAFRLENAAWLDHFSLFMALKDRFGGMAVSDWPDFARSPQRAAAAPLDDELRGDAVQCAFGQWLFFRQWAELRAYARRSGIEVIGDAPIFAALDSADVWANPELFCLGESGRPSAVAGVPPDYFAPTGQLWGNPVYDWAAHARSGYEWWIRRIRSLLQSVDLVRLDHFRGFAAYWEIPATAPTAETGRWAAGPAEDFLEQLMRAVGLGGSNRQRARLPLIAEDLGVVTPDVRRLLTTYELPGMRVLQFAFSGHQDEFLPHTYPVNCVAFTGTHDNDTCRGWFAASSNEERATALRYLRSSESSIVRDMVGALWRSQAAVAIVPAQDILELGSEARMNYPGRSEGYWEWRLPAGALNEALSLDFRSLNARWGRLVTTQAEALVAGLDR